jgi:putative redox protein
MSAEYNIELQALKGQTVLVKSDSGHLTLFDVPVEHGGLGGAPSPFEAFLASIGGCTAMDVISLLKKMRVEYTSFSIEIKARRADEHPKIPTSVELIYKFEGSNIDESAVAKAIELSQEKYCSVSAVVKKAGIPVTWRYEIK